MTGRAVARAGAGAAFAILAVACDPDAPPAGDAVRDADADSARVEIEALEDRMEDAVETNDPDALAALFAEDAVELPPNQPRRVGIPAIRERYAEFLAATPDAVVRLTTDRVEVAESGELAWEVGSARETGTGPDGIPHDVTAKYLVVWERGPDGWRIVARMFSADEAFGE